MDEATRNALESAQAALPSWTPWLAPALLASAALAIFAVTVGLKGLVARRALARVVAEPWPERARVVFAARKSLLSATFFAVFLFALAAMAFPANYIETYGRSLEVSLTALLAIAGLAVYRNVINSARDRPLSLPQSIRSSFAALVLLRGVAVPLCLGMAFAGPAFDARAYTVLGLTLAAFALLQAGGATALLRTLGLLRPAPARVRALVASLAARMNVRVDDIYEVDWRMANAVALPMQRAVVFTVELLERLDDEEISAIAAHELSHLNESRGVLAARVLAQYALMPLVLLHAAWATFGWGGVATAVALPVAVAVPVRLLSQRLEHNADTDSHQEAGGEIHARALQAVYEINLAPAVSHRGATHPDVYDRLLAAGVQPPFERPAPPPRTLSRSAALASWCAAFAVFLALIILPGVLRNRCWESEGYMTAALATASGPVEFWLSALAGMRAQRDDGPGAARLYRSAAVATRESWRGFAYRAAAEAVEGRCERSAELTAQAQELQPGDETENGTPYELHEAARLLAACRDGSRSDVSARR